MTQQPGPFPLTLTNHGDRYVITTAQGNHWLTTFDPHAATLSLAAPDMLEAAQAMVYAWEKDDSTSVRLRGEAISLLISAIAKAKGEST